MTGPSGTRRLVYDGLNLVGEYNNDNLVNDYYIHGTGPDEPLVWYNYQGGSGRQFFHVDERGSIIATSDATGNRLTLDTYDEYGKPGSTNSGAFQYTGQMWLPEAGVYHYKARAYLPHLGIFGQTDPAGYAAGPNFYAYVRDDPVNVSDPLGLGVACEPGVVGGEPQTVTDPVCPDDSFGGSLANLIGGMDPFAKMKSLFRGFHRYSLSQESGCSADDVFAAFKRPDISAPGAPAITRDGVNPQVTLTGDNDITQATDTGARTITNTTNLNHEFYFGTVRIQVTPTAFGSHIEVNGSGNGLFPNLNWILGHLIFGHAANVAAETCSPSPGLIPVHGG